MIIHRYGSDGAWVESAEIGEDDGIPYGWTTLALPNIPDGMVAVMGGDGWVVVDPPGPPPAPVDTTEADIIAALDADRDAHIAGGYHFNGNAFQSRPSDEANITGAAVAASAWLMGGGSPSSLRWASPDNDFHWIAADNTLVAMTAVDVLGLFKAGAAFKTAMIFTARYLKNAVIAADTAAAKRAIYAGAIWPEG